MNECENIISVVVPVYNGSRYLGAALDSVLAQTHREVEVIAVDDGSTDNSPDILASYGERIMVIRQTNGGVAAARNTGIARARGAFVGFLDQDDWWRPEKLARQREVFRQDERIGLVHTEVAYFEENTQSRVPPPNPDARPEEMTGDCYDRLLLGNPICNSSVVVRRSVLDVTGPCDLKIVGNTVQDYDLWLRVAREARFAFVSEPLTFFRLHGAQGHKQRIGMLTEELKVLLRCRPESEWLATPTGRRRLAELYDSLAVAHVEAAQMADARRWFAEAVKTEYRSRRLFRYAASQLPLGVVETVRRAKSRFNTGVSVSP
jgi:glycosyltransferase involved in cell wall biosynthesis